MTHKKIWYFAKYQVGLLSDPIDQAYGLEKITKEHVESPLDKNIFRLGKP